MDHPYHDLPADAILAPDRFSYKDTVRAAVIRACEPTAQSPDPVRRRVRKHQFKVLPGGLA